MIEYLSSHFFSSIPQHSPISIAWYAGNTAQSILALKCGVADIAIVYDPDKVYHLIKAKLAHEDVVHVWLDRFMFIVSNSPLTAGTCHEPSWDNWE